VVGAYVTAKEHFAMSRLPTVFISHGSPDTAIADTAAAAFMKSFGAELPRPKAIVVASAHFEVEGGVAISHDAEPETIHDFGGFDRRLYEMQYPAPGEPALAERIAADLQSAGFRASPVDARGFDHGTWVPLSLIFPQADIPVVQVSVDPTRDAAYHLKLGQALAALRDEGVLVIGSGSFTHNLGEAFKALRAGRRDAEVPDWVGAFVEWMAERILAGDHDALADYRRRAPHAVANHPTDEHLMPLYVAIGAAMGAGGANWTAEPIHSSSEFGVLAMDAYAFH
jgi:4,5-DOPA dioxygenase extradiol